MAFDNSCATSRITALEAENAGLRLNVEELRAALARVEAATENAMRANWEMKQELIVRPLQHERDEALRKLALLRDVAEAAKSLMPVARACIASPREPLLRLHSALAAARAGGAIE